jgi:TonB family protein
MVPPPKVGTPSLAGVATDETRSSAPSNLERETTASRPAPIDLSRATPAPTQTAAVVPTVVPQVDSPRAATLDSNSPRRNLAGAQLAGPVADRELLSHVTPEYPEWAKSEGVEASVTLHFLVLPDGRVKENVLVDRTSGFGDFDENAVIALRQWRFAPASGPGEQWGSITFNFRLTDG